MTERTNRVEITLNRAGLGTVLVNGFDIADHVTSLANKAAPSPQTASPWDAYTDMPSGNRPVICLRCGSLVAGPGVPLVSQFATPTDAMLTHQAWHETIEAPISLILQVMDAASQTASTDEEQQ